MNDELQKRITQVSDEHFIDLHKIEKDYELSIKKLETEIKLGTIKWQSKVDIALLNAGYEIENKEQQ